MLVSSTVGNAGLHLITHMLVSSTVGNAGLHLITRMLCKREFFSSRRSFLFSLPHLTCFLVLDLSRRNIVFVIV